MATGRFITLEGGDGAGKSTQAEILSSRLQQTSHPTVLTREPGGSEKAEEIRAAILAGKAKEYGPFAEALLFSVAREDHLEKTIRPALESGSWVVCDRFADSTRAYQGVSGLRSDVIDALEHLVVGNTVPDLTIILDLPAEEGLRRAAARAAEAGNADAPDRYEAMERGFHEDLRRAFLSIAERSGERCTVVNAQQPESAVAEDIWEAIVRRLDP
ncbi:MAG: dTMP kinase [Methyloligellaceae bacterium]